MVRRRYAAKFSSTIHPSTMHGRKNFSMAFLINLVKMNISTCNVLVLVLVHARCGAGSTIFSMVVLNLVL